MKPSRLARLSLAIMTTAALAACNGGGSKSGQISMAVTDAPVDDAKSVVVEFTGVELMGPGGRTTFEFDEAKTIDLMDLQGSLSEPLIEDETVPAGEYQWARLMVNAQPATIDSYIVLKDESQHSLYIPSGDETGLKMNTGFTVGAGSTANFTVDFDLRKSVTLPMNGNMDYVLRPTLRLVDNLEVGTIAGTVDAGRVTESCAPAVYLFAGADVTPDDEDANEPNPLTSAMPALNTESGGYDYEIGFVPAGEHTITFTCEADADQADSDDSITFSDTQNVTVVAEETTTVDFN
ncbi:MAG: DUF4382 domain-containing protein [Gammaproteobacteria bacterium]|nr:DUF4382 domain-containing protein [Gammaproteobacteria bacterium]